MARQRVAIGLPVLLFGGAAGFRPVGVKAVQRASGTQISRPPSPLLWGRAEPSRSCCTVWLLMLIGPAVKFALHRVEEVAQLVPDRLVIEIGSNICRSIVAATCRQ